MTERATTGNPLVAPATLISEVAAAVRRGTDEASGERAIQLLLMPGFIVFESVSTALAERAAETAVQLGLKGCDAIYVALAIQSGEPLVTFDREQLIRGGRVADVFEPPAPI